MRDYLGIITVAITSVFTLIGTFWQIKGTSRGSDVDLSKEVKDSLEDVKQLSKENIALNEQISRLKQDNAQMKDEIKQLTQTMKKMREELHELGGNY